ncbi:hypothetical protein B0H11DRAFT_2300488 [Mycena galericulata]|nr:hypothetical protein B0H11DRAFT_2300488 [Mycena galericulata]
MVPGNHGISGQTSPFISSVGAPIQGIARGSVVLPPESVGILRRLDAAREKRNEKREERREKGDNEVSEDEPDELTPFLMVASAQERSGPGNSRDAAFQKTATPHIAHCSNRLLFEDAVAEKNSFQAHDNSIPDASLERLRSGNVKTVKHGTGEMTRVTVIDVSEFPDEETLDQATFLTCYNTFLTFLEASAGPRIFRGFVEHYNRILSNPDLSTWFAAYQVFDKKIRAQFFTKPYIIDVQDSQYRDALQSAKNLLLMSSSEQDEDPDSSSFGVKTPSSRALQTSAMLSNPATGPAVSGGSDPIDKVSWTPWTCPDNSSLVEHQAEAGDSGNFKPKSFRAAATVGGALETGGARSPSPLWNEAQMNRGFGGENKDDDKEMEGNGGAVGDHNGDNDGDNDNNNTSSPLASIKTGKRVAAQAAPIYRKKPRLSTGQQALRDITSSAAEINEIFAGFNARL